MTSSDDQAKAKAAPKPPPDYRFTLANERTFLAWMRTSLALVGGGLAMKQFIQNMPGHVPVSLFVILLGLYVGATAYFSWASNERAITDGAPLPSSWKPAILAVGVAAIGASLAALILMS